MKYFTKEWYGLCQKTSLHLLLEEAKEAETFSEEYFQQLYDQKLNEWLTLQQEIASVPFNDVLPDETENIDESFSDKDKASREAYQLKWETAKVNYNLLEPFNREKECDQFHKAFIYRQQDAQKKLPQEILKKIADLRVFVFDKASRLVIEDVTRFCEENRRLVEATRKEYGKYYENELKSFYKDIIDNIHFHYCDIKKMEENEKSLTITFDNPGFFTDIEEMKLENFRIIKQDALLEDAWWLYEEIYIIDGKYELHALLQDKSLGLIEFTVLAENILFKKNGNNSKCIRCL